MPSGKAWPVTRPKTVTTPTCPVLTQDADENATIAARPINRSVPTPRTNVFPPLPPALSRVNGSRMLPPQMCSMRGEYNAQVSVLFQGENRVHAHRAAGWHV